MEIQLRFNQQAELGAPTQDSLSDKDEKDTRVKPKSDMRAVHGRLARKLLKTARRKIAGDNYREVQE